MRRIIFIVVLFFCLCSLQSPIYAANSTKSQMVSDKFVKKEIKNTKSETKTTSGQSLSESNSSSLFPLFIKFIFSFLLVIGLLYLLLRYLAKRNRLLPSNGPILSLGGQTLGNNKSMQVLLIGQTIYIVGVGESVTLMRTISQGEEYQYLLENFDNQTRNEMFSQNWLPMDIKKVWDSVFHKNKQNKQYELDDLVNSGQDQIPSRKWVPIDTKKIWNSIFRKDVQSMRNELNSFDIQGQGDDFSQKWNSKDSNKNWDSVFSKQLQKMQQDNEEEI